MRDVVVIGAGLSGLTAAWELTRSGRSVQVVEARDRTGGRAHCPKVNGHPVDLGPTWVWDSERSIHRLLRTLDIPTFAHFDDGLDVYESDGLQRGRFPRSTVLSRRIVGGAARVAATLAQQVDAIQLNAPVRVIEPIKDGLRVVTDAGHFDAHQVLAGLPPSLVAPMISELDPERAQLWSRVPVWMGDIAKVALLFDRPFWKDHGWSGRGASSRGPMSEIHDMSGLDDTPACLFGFVPESAGLDALADRVRDQLLRMFGPEAVPTQVVLQPWWREPFTTTPQHRGDLRLFGHTVLRAPALSGRLQLISCETSGVSPGHLDGAVERAQAVCSAR